MQQNEARYKLAKAGWVLPTIRPRPRTHLTPTALLSGKKYTSVRLAPIEFVFDAIVSNAKTINAGNIVANSSKFSLNFHKPHIKLFNYNALKVDPKAEKSFHFFQFLPKMKHIAWLKLY